MIASRWAATCAWIAGFLDGEGCLDITKKGQCRVRATQKHLLPLSRLQEVTGMGSIYKDRDAHVWCVSRKKEVFHLLCHVAPYLRTNKGAQAEVILAFQRKCIDLEMARKTVSDLKRLDLGDFDGPRLSSVFSADV